MYNRGPVLPVDIKFALNSDLTVDTKNQDQPFDYATFETVLASATSLRTEIHEKAGENIKIAQRRQKIQYDRRHTSPTELKAGMQVLLQNNKRKDRKGGKFSYKWRGPYILQEIDHKGVASLQTMSGGEL